MTAGRLLDRPEVNYAVVSGRVVRRRDLARTGRGSFILTFFLENRTFGPALPLVHPALRKSRSGKLKDCGRKLELRCGVFDLHFPPPPAAGAVLWAAVRPPAGRIVWYNMKRALPGPRPAQEGMH